MNTVTELAVIYVNERPQKTTPIKISEEKSRALLEPQVTFNLFNKFRSASYRLKGLIICDFDPEWIRIQSSLWLRIRIQEGKITHKIEKSYEISCIESAGCSLLRAADFSFSLNVLYGGLGIKNCNFG
jgi:hypothetical protein